MAGKENNQSDSGDIKQMLCAAGFASVLRLQVVLFTSFWSLLAGSSTAGDWPQILGPNRNGIAVNEKLADQWPAGGPKLVWEAKVGRGYSGVAVAGERLLLFHRIKDEEVLELRNAWTGRLVWSKSAAVRYQSSIAPDDGPRCVPVVDKDQVYVLGVAGHLRCHRLKDGELLWQHFLEQEFDIPPAYFGVGSTPIVEANKLLVNVGGKKGAGIVAFNTVDGKVVWQATDEGTSYSSPTVATVDGVRHAIFVTRLNCVSLDPANGKVRFSFPFGQRGPTVNGAAPLVIDGHLFLTASYGIGAVWAKIEPTKADVVWNSDDVMSSQYTTPVEHDGRLLGIDGRQDQGVARLRCFDPKTQKVAWTQEGFGTGNLILTDEKIIVLKTSGELLLIAADPKQYRELAKAKALDGTAQPLPALADGRLYIRDQHALKCFDLR